MWVTSELTDKPRILAYLERDRLYAGYAIGDLEPGMYEQCTWIGAETAGQLQALALIFRGLSLPVLLLVGAPDGLRAVLEDIPRPERAYLSCRTGHLAMARDFYAWDEPSPMWRMALRPERFRPAAAVCTRLTPVFASQLRQLYVLGGGGAFDPAQIRRGVFFGIFVNGWLVAAAGTHLISPTYGVAAVGNVFTHPDRRGQGYGTAVTSAVVAELLRRGIRDIILNVSQDNAAAIHVYERLGFERYCPFLEGSAFAQKEAQ
jgi:ribosomal protein S18 acetylase RimI-like enzyme